MVIDTSALLAILRDEPERRTFTEAIEAAETRYGAAGLRDLDALVAFTLPLFPYETRSESRRVC
jgi:uncharacterized protein with PIN domain